MKTDTEPHEAKTNLEIIEKLMAGSLSLAVTLVILGGLAGLGVLWVYHKQLGTLDDLGTFGSYLQGAVGSLWSLAGVLLIFAAFWAQKQQLIHQAAEFRKFVFPTFESSE